MESLEELEDLISYLEEIETMTPFNITSRLFNGTTSYTLYTVHGNVSLSAYLFYRIVYGFDISNESQTDYYFEDFCIDYKIADLIRLLNTIARGYYIDDIIKDLERETE